MLLEDCKKVHEEVHAKQPYFEVDAIFVHGKEYASYAQRYEVLCERLMLERKYNATCLILATNTTPSNVSFPLPPHDFRHFAAAIDAHARLFAATA